MKVYFKQAWQLLRQNKLFSSIYILGTGLAIAMTMTLVIIYYIKMMPVYPELNRDRILVSKGVSVKKSKGNGSNTSYLSYHAVCQYFYPLTKHGAEAVTAVPATWGSAPLVEFPGEQGVQSVQVKYTDVHFWKVFNFSFTAGKPFTEADFQSGMRTAVISKDIARRLFGEGEAVGKTFLLNAEEYRVCGVVRDVSFITHATFADIWVPFTVNPNTTKLSGWAEGLLGSFQVYILAKNGEAAKEIKETVDDSIRKINTSQDKYIVELNDQPVLYWKSIFYEYADKKPDWNEILQRFGTMLLALLLVPALNLAGMISSRIERRLSELGLRKAFGASRRRLLGQVLTENLLLTCLGGIVGLILSYLIIYMGRNWLPSLFSGFSPPLPGNTDTFFTPDMLFNPTVFGITFGICLILNVLSALIPAWNALRKDIVYSLNDNK